MSLWNIGVASIVSRQIIEDLLLSLFFTIRNAVPNRHFVALVADQDIVTLTFWTCIRKVLGLIQGRDFSCH
jgi:hypothetical protein